MSLVSLAKSPVRDGVAMGIDAAQWGQWKHISDAVQVALQELPESERHILCRRFGLDGRVYSLEEVSREFGISRDRVAQIEERALSILRANAVRHSAGAERKQLP